MSWPFGSETVVIARVAGAIASDSCLLWLCAGLLLSVTLKVRARPLVAAVGVPVIAPVAELNVAQEGNEPEVMLHV